MRAILRSISPAWARRLWFSIKERAFLARNPDPKARFSEIYRKNVWQNPESGSGYGSTEAATRQAREGLQRLIDAGGVGSILDVPSGDYNWMKLLNFQGHYTGADIVEELVQENKRRYSDERHEFAVLDLIKDTLPAADLVMCRECLNHLSLNDGAAAFQHLAASPKRYLVVTHYPSQLTNVDQETSFRYRRLNLTLAPFGAREPDVVIDESQFDPGKCLAVWDVTRGAIPKRA